MLRMIKDVTGIKLTPGNNGDDCLGDGRHYDKKGRKVECCCAGCAHLICCTEADYEALCKDCTEFLCPRCKDKFSAFLRFFADALASKRAVKK